ncbi:MAG: HAMP domain-containing histidine kinase [Lachnospiraceae bacterium]|nr:HAMP domain-containing histidine kinase [Lachnospiraceae bacterium]
MKIFVTKNIKTLFIKMLLCMSACILLSVLLINLEVKHATIYILVAFLFMDAAILAVCYRYFQTQNKIMEDAVAQMKEYISGNENARIACNDEGELYRLFYEVNSLVSTLNAHAKNERNAKKFLKHTISDISHQLKTPLAALNIYNGIIQEEAKNLPTIKSFTDLSEQELDRIETLVQNLLKITKFDAGTMVIEKTNENVSEMMECVKEQFAYRAGQEEKEIRLTGDETITLLCDRGWLTEAVGNIVKNALDHTNQGDFVCVEWKQSATVVQIVVKDTGSGIDPEDVHHIFKRFYRSRYSKDTQGIGLGLPLVKAVVEAHNGTIAVDSELGVGTVFTINFLIQ